MAKPEPVPEKDRRNNVGRVPKPEPKPRVNPAREPDPKSRCLAARVVGGAEAVLATWFIRE